MADMSSFPGQPKLTKLELRIMEILWQRGASSVREIQESFPAIKRPAFTTIQTTIYRMEEKKAVRIARRIGKANIFEPAVTRQAAENRLIDELLSLFGGRAMPIVARLLESGKLTPEDVRNAEEIIHSLRKGKAAPK
jgi:predicted transcriptional regulator